LELWMVELGVQSFTMMEVVQTRWDNLLIVRFCTRECYTIC
jgi:hypothetical protein